MHRPAYLTLIHIPWLVDLAIRREAKAGRMAAWLAIAGQLQLGAGFKDRVVALWAGSARGSGGLSAS